MKRLLAVLVASQVLGFGLVANAAAGGPVISQLRNSSLCRYCQNMCSGYFHNNQLSKNAPQKCHTCENLVCCDPNSKYAITHGLSRVLGNGGLTPTASTSNSTDISADNGNQTQNGSQHGQCVGCILTCLNQVKATHPQDAAAECSPSNTTSCNGFCEAGSVLVVLDAHTKCPPSAPNQGHYLFPIITTMPDGTTKTTNAVLCHSHSSASSSNHSSSPSGH